MMRHIYCGFEHRHCPNSSGSTPANSSQRKLRRECLPLVPDLPLIHSGEDAVIGCFPLLNTALPCPICGLGIEDLEICYFVSPKWTWEERYGRAGWLTICAKCEMQIQFFPQYWN